MNRTTIIFVMLCAALLITSCVPIAKYYVCSDGKQVPDAAQCQVNQPEIPAEETPAVTEPAEPEPQAPIIKDISSDAQELMDKITKVNTIKFLYSSSDNLYTENIYYASRDKMKIELKTKVEFSPTESYDTVYYDFTGLNAFAYCEQLDLTICPDRNKKFSIDYGTYIIKTPFSWFSLISKANLSGKSKMIEGRNAKEMNFELDGKTGTMFLDSYYGIPLAITYGDMEYAYRNMEINEVKLTELEHQTLSNEV
jgi:hypothetical protein